MIYHAYILAQVGYGDISMFELGFYYTRNGIVGGINRALIAYEKSKFFFFLVDQILFGE